MKWNWFKYMAPLGDEGTDNAGGTPAVATDPAIVDEATLLGADTTPEEAAPEVKADEGAQEQPKESDKAADAAKPNGRVANLMEDDEVSADGSAIEQFDYNEGEAIPLGVNELGEEIELSGEEIKSYLDSLPADMQNRTSAVGALVKHEQGKLAAQREFVTARANELIQESQKEFGADLKRVVSEARRGGHAIFGEMFGEMCQSPLFANDPRVIRALSKYGRSITPDAGVVRPAQKQRDNAINADDWMNNN